MEAEVKTIVSASTILLNLIPVIIGGFLAATGAFVGAFLTHRLNQKAVKNKIKREKLEQLANAIYRTMHWLKEHKDTHLFGQDKDIGSLPMFEVQYLSKLYFPELEQEVATMFMVFSNIQLLVIETINFKISNKSFPNNFSQNYGVLYEELLLAVNDLMKNVSAIAEEL